MVSSTYLFAALLLAGAPASSNAQMLAETTLVDTDGRKVGLSRYADRSILVIGVLGTECPLVKAYAVRLNEFAREWRGKDVAVIAIFPNAQDSPQEVTRFQSEYELSMPCLLDPGAAVADRLGATRTPEMFVLDAARAIRYQGRIDDQLGVGATRKAEYSEYLRSAVWDLLEGRSVAEPAVPAVGCLIGRARRMEEASAITYSGRIAGILQSRCLECHRPGDVGPFAMTDYQEVAGWADMIREVVNQRRMPPWHADPAYGTFSNSNRLTDEEIRDINAWVDAGAPEGDPSQTPAPPVFSDSWRIPKPDLVFAIAPEPVPVAAYGDIPYQNFIVDPGITTDRWVWAAENRPDNRAVVHHMSTWIIPPGMKDDDFTFAPIVGFAPGTPPLVCEPGTAFFVPAGSKFRIQMHYQSIGVEAHDRSTLGLCFTDPKEVKQVLVADSIHPVREIDLPPQTKKYALEGRLDVGRDMLLTKLLPHMHFRGDAFRLDVAYPDGRHEVLINVPRYDFNWQLIYDLEKPILIPKGSTLHCTGWFDNSADNPRNPDPDARVVYGPQTDDEMLFCHFYGIDPTSRELRERYIFPAEGFSAPPDVRVRMVTTGGATAQLLSDGASGVPIRVVINDGAAGEAGSVQLERAVGRIVQGESYLLSFLIRSVQPRSISAQIGSPATPDAVSLPSHRQVGPEWQHVRVDFDAAIGLEEAVLRIDLGETTGEVELRQVGVAQGKYH